MEEYPSIFWKAYQRNFSSIYKLFIWLVNINIRSEMNSNNSIFLPILSVYFFSQKNTDLATSGPNNSNEEEKEENILNELIEFVDVKREFDHIEDHRIQNVEEPQRAQVSVHYMP